LLRSGDDALIRPRIKKPMPSPRILRVKCLQGESTNGRGTRSIFTHHTNGHDIFDPIYNEAETIFSVVDSLQDGEFGSDQPFHAAYPLMIARPRVCQPEIAQRVH